MAWQIRGAAAGCLTLLVLLTGCAGGGGGSGARPSASLSISPTRSVPTPTRSPIVTDEPTEGSSATPTGGPSKTDTPETPKTSATPRPSTTQPSPTQPGSSPTEASTTAEPTGTGSTSPAPSSSPSEAESSAEGEGDSTDDGVPAWVWWLLAAVLVAAIVLAWWLVARARRRRLWEEQLQAAEGEAAWLARELLPQLRSTGSREGVAGGWQVGVPRVAALEDQLTVLESSAPAEADGARARALRDAVRATHARVDAITAGGPQDTWAHEIDEAIALLEAALAPSVQPGP